MLPAGALEEPVEAEAEVSVETLAPTEEDLPVPDVMEFDLAQLRAELLSIRRLLDS